MSFPKPSSKPSAQFGLAATAAKPSQKGVLPTKTLVCKAMGEDKTTRICNMFSQTTLKGDASFSGVHQESVKNEDGTYTNVGEKTRFTIFTTGKEGMRLVTVTKVRVSGKDKNSYEEICKLEEKTSKAGEKRLEGVTEDGTTYLVFDYKPFKA